MGKVELSIVVVNFNTKELVSECLSSIEKYPPDGNFEVIVVDNGSTDGSYRAIRNAKRKTQNAKVKVIQNSENVGFAKANNQGIEKAKGEFVLLLNSDAKVTRGALSLLVKFAKGKERLGGVGPRLVNPDGSDQASAFYLPTLRRAIEQFWLARREWFGKYLPKRDEVASVEALVMAAFLVPRKVFDQVGLLDGRYFMYFEDLDYCRRLGQAKLPIYYLPEAKIVHYHGGSGEGERPKQWLVQSSNIYHGWLKGRLIFLVMWTGQKWQSLK